MLDELFKMKFIVVSMSVESAPSLVWKKIRIAWDIIQNDLLNAANYYLEGGEVSSSINSTLLTLIPKVQHPRSFSEFQQISLCNFMYKILSKLVVVKLKILIPKLISQEQHGFAEGRSIGDCISLAQIIVDELDMKTLGGNMILKLDIMKDRRQVRLGFHLW
ncbi:unnamed protein product [Ilex paraguariensis]|uniref:Reverse transcriptase domain-containing protein n=1 Tax=Ilex paraguariensis TaxID=185542 RepID=A0ABC8R459_9AQUA